MREWRKNKSSVLWQHVAEGKTLGERLRMNGNVAGSAVRKLLVCTAYSGVYESTVMWSNHAGSYPASRIERGIIWDF